MNTPFLIIFIGLQIADIWSTDKALRLGKREANPLLNWLFQRFDPVGVMVAMQLVAVWLLWYADVYVVTGLLCAFYLWVVDNNIRVIRGG